MSPFLVSLSTVAIAEMGDRTQLLSLMLAARFRRPAPVLGGILCATLLNHAAAGLIGAHFGRYLTPARLDALVGISMLAMALWALRPDSLSETDEQAPPGGAFTATVVAFFVAEIGDKTQIATVALAAGFDNLPAVIAGTTAGMLIANAPVVLLGHSFAARLPLRALRYVASGLFLGLGGWFLWRAWSA